tara:strand:- start:521 stop:1081 length:561 start_codon:yes stop_codon:yes gene_type:complete
MKKLKGKERARSRQRDFLLKKKRNDSYKADLLKLIRTFGDPVLSEICELVKEKSELDFLKQLAKVLAATKDGVGLAAPQIGILKCAFVVRLDIKINNFLFFINPQITDFIGEEIEVVEGCLSYPGVTCPVQRHNKIVVNYFDENMKEMKITLSGKKAVIFQHELDHISNPPVCEVGNFWRESEKKS